MINSNGEIIKREKKEKETSKSTEHSNHIYWLQILQRNYVMYERKMQNAIDYAIRYLEQGGVVKDGLAALKGILNDFKEVK